MGSVTTYIFLVYLQGFRTLLPCTSSITFGGLQQEQRTSCQSPACCSRKGSVCFMVAVLLVREKQIEDKALH